MPELPDVEGFRRVLDEHTSSRRIRAVTVLDPSVLRDSSATEFSGVLDGRMVTGSDRRGKWLLLRTGGPTVLLHFGMTGQLVWCGADEPRHRHDRIVFSFRHGELRYRDMRKLRGVWLAADESAVDRLLGENGPDALHITRAEFAQRLTATSRQVKPALTDQSVLAGLGNLLADEILWRARIDPRRRTRDLAEAECRALYAEMRRVLRRSIPTGRVPPRRGWLTGVRDECEASCPRCGHRLERRSTGGRTTVSCPNCQPPH